MVEIGDRIVIESEKVGQAKRHGSVIGLSGRLLRIHWRDGSESLLMPSAGALRVIGHQDHVGDRKGGAAD